MLTARFFISRTSNLEPRTSNLEPRTSNLEPRISNLPHGTPVLCTSKSGNTLETYILSSLGGFSRKSEKSQRNLDFFEFWKVVFQILYFPFLRVTPLDYIIKII